MLLPRVFFLCFQQLDHQNRLFLSLALGPLLLSPAALLLIGPNEVLHCDHWVKVRTSILQQLNMDKLHWFHWEFTCAYLSHCRQKLQMSRFKHAKSQILNYFPLGDKSVVFCGSLIGLFRINIICFLFPLNVILLLLDIKCSLDGQSEKFQHQIAKMKRCIAFKCTLIRFP